MISRKPLWKLSVDTTLEAEDAVMEMLNRLTGRPASAFFDFEAGISRVSVYVPEKITAGVREKAYEGMKQIRDCGLQIGVGKISINRVRKEDWRESWKRHFKPIEVGSTLLVKPGWSKKKRRKNQAVVILNPGLSFGTGQHPTTAFCLREIARNSRLFRSRGSLQKNGQSFLDMGTGSGILAISAAKLGYAPVHAFDFDPEAIRTARANIRMNGVLGKIQIVRRDVTKLPAKPKEKYNFICANLISGLLVSEGKHIVSQLNRGGILVLAGILKAEFPAVQRKYEELGLKLVSTKGEKEWQSGSFRFV